MLKARLLVGAVITVVALAASTSMGSAAVKHVPHKAKPAAVAATFDSGPPASLRCGKGQTPELHTIGKMRWVCVKAASA